MLGIMLASSFQVMAQENVEARSEVIIDVGTDLFQYESNGLIYTVRNITTKDVENYKQSIGVRDINNVISNNGFNGTGGALPTSEEWDDMVGDLEIVNIAKAPDSNNINAAVTQYDFSTSPYFPQVGNQGRQGSCAAWAMTYYAFGYREAIKNNWNEAHNGNPAQLLSPAWTYNKACGGVDETGSSTYSNAKILQSWGATTLDKMPYNGGNPINPLDHGDYTSWGSQLAWEEAPLHRAVCNEDVDFIHYNSGSVDVVKDLVSTNYPVTFSIDSNEIWGDLNHIISANEYSSTITNHAQTIVGFNDAITEDGETGAFRVVNSWGTGWGDNGFYWLTYDAFNEIGTQLLLRTIHEKASYIPTLIANWYFVNGVTPGAYPYRAVTFGISATSATTPMFGDLSPAPFYIPDPDLALPQYMCIDISQFTNDYFINKAGTFSFQFSAGDNAIFRSASLLDLDISYYLTGYVPGAMPFLKYNSPDIGNILPYTYTIKLDNSLPTSSITPITPLWGTSSSKILTATASDTGSNIYYVECFYRSSGSSTWVSKGKDYSTPYSWSFNFPAQGLYEFYSASCDIAGNFEYSVAPTTYDTRAGYDITAPSTFSLLSPTNGFADTDNQPALDWSTSTDTMSNIYGYNVYLTGPSSYTWFTTGSAYADTPVALSTGTWSWRVQAIDNAGNTRYSNELWSFTINSPPAPLAIVKGYVYISGTTTGIFNANVECSAGVSTLTLTTGYYEMLVTSGSSYSFTASVVGYNSQSFSYFVNTGINAGVNFALTVYVASDPTCFVRDTMIATPTGVVPIQLLSIGDYVLSFNETTENVEPNKVLKTFSHPPQEYLLINGILGVTGNHILYANGGQVLASTLREGDVLKTLDGPIQVTSILCISIRQNAYNIEVENNHNYYAEGILAHNVYKGPDDPIPTPGSWCPFVYVWNGSDYIQENNLLPEATDYTREALDVVDYYSFSNNIIQKDGMYSLCLYENWTERTNFDEIKLITIDSPADYDGFVDITEDGSVETASFPMAPVDVINNEDIIISDQTSNIDGAFYSAMVNEPLLLNFDIVNCMTPKLVVYHKTGNYIVKPYTYYPNPLDDPNRKCSIHVQIINDGEWTDIETIPARINWVCDIVNLTSIADYLRDGGEIRLLTTGRHLIDFIGLDISDESVPCTISYLTPLNSHYIGNNNTDLSSTITDSDKIYLQMNPDQIINISFPYIQSEIGARFFALKTVGHYYSIPPIAIIQPVTINIMVNGSSTGEVTTSLEEVYGATTIEMTWLTIDLSQGHAAFMEFEQKPDKQYRLVVTFNNCAPDAIATITINSLRGSHTLEYDASDGTRFLPLGDILWNVTGVIFNPISSRYQVLRDTILMFEMNRDNGWNMTGFDAWDWNFGDGIWTNDIKPTHVYESIGNYVLNLTFSNITSGAKYEVVAFVEVINSPPIPTIEIHQDVELTLTVSGRKDNTVGIRIYEDGTLIQSSDVMRTGGPLNTFTIGLNKYLDRVYEIELVYNADHKGTNPTSLIFTSGVTIKTFSQNFNTNKGYNQIVSVPMSYLEDVVENNPTFLFDASGSYDIDGEIVTYTWDFGDGSTSEGMIAQHTFAEPGQYTVMLTVEDGDGIIASESVVINVSSSMCVNPVPRPVRINRDQEIKPFQ
jgi:PKD repeat protein